MQSGRERIRLIAGFPFERNDATVGKAFVRAEQHEFLHDHAAAVVRDDPYAQQPEDTAIGYEQRDTCGGSRDGDIVFGEVIHRSYPCGERRQRIIPPQRVTKLYRAPGSAVKEASKTPRRHAACDVGEPNRALLAHAIFHAQSSQGISIACPPGVAVRRANWTDQVECGNL